MTTNDKWQARMMHDGIWNIIEESECLFTETAGDQNNLGFHNITKIALI